MQFKSKGFLGWAPYLFFFAYDRPKVKELKARVYHGGNKNLFAIQIFANADLIQSLKFGAMNLTIFHPETDDASQEIALKDD